MTRYPRSRGAAVLKGCGRVAPGPGGPAWRSVPPTGGALVAFFGVDVPLAKQRPSVDSRLGSRSLASRGLVEQVAGHPGQVRAHRLDRPVGVPGPQCGHQFRVVGLVGALAFP